MKLEKMFASHFFLQSRRFEKKERKTDGLFLCSASSFGAHFSGATDERTLHIAYFDTSPVTPFFHRPEKCVSIDKKTLGEIKHIKKECAQTSFKHSHIQAES